MRPHAIRRLGAVLNELGQLQMRSGHLGPADALFLDSLSAFTEVDDAANAALLLLNRAAIARQRALRFERAAQAAAQQASEAEGAQAAAQAAAQAGNTGGELHHLLEVVEHQRAELRDIGLTKRDESCAFQNERLTTNEHLLTTHDSEHLESRL